MVTQTIISAVISVEKTIDAVDNVTSASMKDQEVSQEEIMMRKLATETKKVINETLSAAVLVERALTSDKSLGSPSDWGTKSHSQEERPW